MWQAAGNVCVAFGRSSFLSNNCKLFCPHLNVRVIFASGTPLPGTTLFLAMIVELRVAKDGDSPAIVEKRERCAAVQTFLVCTWDGQDHRHRQVNNPTYGGQRSDTPNTSATPKLQAIGNFSKGLEGSRGYVDGSMSGGYGTDWSWGFIWGENVKVVSFLGK